MTPRNTSTGAVLEAMVLPALQRGGYTSSTQVETGTRPGGRRHLVDAVAEKDGETVLVSLKWQQTGGTAEQKVPFEVMCLADAVLTGRGARAYLVLGGDGWTLRDYFTSGALSEHLIHAGLVRVVTLEAFIRLANQGNPHAQCSRGSETHGLVSTLGLPGCTLWVDCRRCSGGKLALCGLWNPQIQRDREDDGRHGVVCLLRN